jgi:hypothetical protein
MPHPEGAATVAPPAAESPTAEAPAAPGIERMPHPEGAAAVALPAAEFPMSLAETPMVALASLPVGGEEGQGGSDAAAGAGTLRVMAAAATSFANVPTDPSSSGGSGTPRAARMHIGRCISLWAAWHTLPQYRTDLQAEHRRRGGPHRAPPQNAQGLPVPALARQLHGPRPEGWSPGDEELSLSVILVLLPPSTDAGEEGPGSNCLRASTPAAN